MDAIGPYTLFALSALVITGAGSRLAYIVDRLADRTGMGEAIAGAVFLGATTSLPGIVASTTAAAQGHAELAISNAVGGIAAQTAFLAIADMFYRRANLEHAAASAENIMQSALLVTLLAIPLVATGVPDTTLLGIHPATPLLFGFYLYGLKLVSVTRGEAMWKPRWTSDTREDVPDATPHGERLLGLWLQFGLFAGLLAAAGWVIAETAVVIVARTGLAPAAVGGIFTAVVTSLPELVTTVAAVRRGALTLAVGDIIGGNTFDTLFVAASDVAYRDGSIYHAITERQSFLIALTVVMTGTLLMGLVRRQRYGFARIGFESISVLLLYGGAVALMLSY